MLSWSADAFLHCCEILCEDSMDKSTFVANQFVFVSPAARAAVTVLRLSISSGESRKQVKQRSKGNSCNLLIWQITATSNSSSITSLIKNTIYKIQTSVSRIEPGASRLQGAHLAH